MLYKLAVIAFPGNNSENETARAAHRIGFDAEVIRWNQSHKIGNYDAYVLPGGFSYEDRGRAGYIASQEPIFEKIREEASKGKLILGICNGAQMVMEAGLIPVKENPFPLALAKNLRTSENGEILGEGFINQWSYIAPVNKKTAFTNQIEKPLFVPFAHAEGRFTSVDESVLKALEEDQFVGFRYSDENGKTSAFDPICPNGAAGGVAGVVNKEGTIMALMPHPERFWKECDGDLVFASMLHWLDNNELQSTKLGDVSQREMEVLGKFSPKDDKKYIAKKLIITDNEAFSLTQVAQNLTGEKGTLSQMKVYELEGSPSVDTIVETGILCNLNKEFLVKDWEKSGGTLVEEFRSAEDSELKHRLEENLDTSIELKSYCVWNCEGFSEEAQQKLITHAVFSNPHSAKLWTV